MSACKTRILRLIAVFLLNLRVVLNLSHHSLLQNYPKHVLKVAYMERPEEVIVHYGYPTEIYTVTTEDGYILSLLRIPRPNAYPMLLVHGLRSDAFMWLMMGPKSDFAYWLYDLGYDVWLPNLRGSLFSKGHVKFNSTEDHEYWNFSWHQMGLFDLPAIIDFILRKTAWTRLSIVAHSMGCSAFFVLTSLRPEYNNKIDIMHAFTPAVYLKHAHPFAKVFAGISVFKDRKRHPFSFPMPIPHTIGPACFHSEETLAFCKLFFFTVVGFDDTFLNQTMLPIVFHHFPGGASAQQVAHFVQVQHTDVFAPLNGSFFGRHDVPIPEPYPLERVTAKVALYYTLNDRLIGMKDVVKLGRMLPNLVLDYLIPNAAWNHLDPVLATNSRAILYEKVMKIQKRYVDVKCKT